VGGTFGSESEPGVARLNVDGSIDDSFGTAGFAIDGGDAGSFADITVQPDGSILAAGEAGGDPLLARLYAGDVAGTAVNVISSSPALPLPLSGSSTASAGSSFTLTLGDGTTDLGSGSEVEFDISWGDGSPDTIVTADALAAQQDELSHIFNAATSGITVSLWVNGVSYGEVGSLAVGVDLSDATTTGLVASSYSTTFGQTIAVGVGKITIQGVVKARHDIAARYYGVRINHLAPSTTKLLATGNSNDRAIRLHRHVGDRAGHAGGGPFRGGRDVVIEHGRRIAVRSRGDSLDQVIAGRLVNVRIAAHRIRARQGVAASISPVYNPLGDRVTAGIGRRQGQTIRRAGYGGSRAGKGQRAHLARGHRHGVHGRVALVECAVTAVHGAKRMVAEGQRRGDQGCHVGASGHRQRPRP
jgi:hypothetical protein